MSDKLHKMIYTNEGKKPPLTKKGLIEALKNIPDDTEIVIDRGDFGTPVSDIYQCNNCKGLHIAPFFDEIDDDGGNDDDVGVPLIPLMPVKRDAVVN